MSVNGIQGSSQGSKIYGLLSQARINEEKLRHFQQVQMRLLRAKSLPMLLDTLLDDCRESFNLDAVSLSLADPDQELRSLLAGTGIDSSGATNLCFTESRATIERSYKGQTTPILGPYSPQTHAGLFPSLRIPPQSVAMLPLVGSKEWIGSAHFASSDPYRYDPSIATDFLEHFGTLLAVCLENNVNQERLRRAGLVDQLTSVNNRRFFDQRLQEEVSRVLRQRTPLSCLFIDIDHFKQVNDRFGHQSGDLVLAGIAQRINSQLRDMDVLARYGGEEFSALLSNTDLQEAIEVGERVRSDVANHTVEIFNNKRRWRKRLRVTVSIGVATLWPDFDLPEPALCANLLLEQADQALYQAKRGGRNRLEFWDHVATANTSAWRKFAPALKRSLKLA